LGFLEQNWIFITCELVRAQETTKVTDSSLKYAIYVTVNIVQKTGEMPFSPDGVIGIRPAEVHPANVLNTFL
jgi:hypothetical protein